MFIEENSTPSEKLKAWYLFTDDFVAGTQHLSPLAVGIYVRLLCWNWNKKCKGIPDNAEIINRIAGTRSDEEQEICGQVINEFFVHIVDADNIENNKWQNARQLKEWLYINNRIANARENGKKGGRPKNPDKTPLPLTPTSTKDSNMVEFEKEIWGKIKIKKGSKIKAFEKWSSKKDKTTNNIIVEKYNALISKTDDATFIPHLATWLHGERWEEDLTNEIKENNFGVRPKKSHKDYVSFVKKGIRSTNISDDMVRLMWKENLITEAEYKAW
jgi:uncharacterized protein YdaU (DUF1376 family)